MAKDNPETNPSTIKPETGSHEAEQFSWVPLLSCSPPGRPFPVKSLAFSAHVSPQTIHFQVLGKSPVSGPGRGPPSCNKTTGRQVILLLLGEKTMTRSVASPGSMVTNPSRFPSYSTTPCLTLADPSSLETSSESTSSRKTLQPL